ncbi:MAG TPA: V-type ATP synthase subunit D [Anaerolineae bacterium]|nr:V-type ATP synthase subunit D [Anaerolineae bacterium]HOQ99334.1 V-type ATP synthase subunit D [Anaerolineae bacterium]HPL30421.1 V-type ATP synthase subunit D [Anaerolineae bacterium]
MREGNVAPTRAVLLEARRSLAQAREGHDLLDRKRHALIAYAQDMLAHTEDVEQRLDERFRAAYQALAQARMAMGVARVEWVALSARKEATVDISERSVMGAPVPAIHAEPRRLTLQYSLSDTSAAIDRAAQAFGELLPIVARAAELATAARRLAGEIRRTQRRVNALQHVLIPRYGAIVAQVEGALEEKEREDLFRAKAVKRLHEGEEQ